MASAGKGLLCGVCHEFAWKGRMQLDLLVHCHHCQRQVCVHCLDKHRKSYKLEVRMNLNYLSCQKANLWMRSEQLNAMVKNSRGRIAGAMEEAVSELHTAASKALYAAIAKVKAVDLESTQTINELIHRITELSTEVNKVQDVSNLLKGTKTLQNAVDKWQHLKSLLDKAAELKTMIRNLPPLPITQIRLSDRVSEINQQLKDCTLNNKEVIEVEQR
ncbi:conserved hypothetical protein [Echinococcus multilocularis]|uniref:Uncharacterized protein n=1 Tax=Echinococcus multilocularis TaxID=6211 RepID=A0A068Y3N3_ECHMU|nr:conserved hypothetical protein [Echinococcus multilocularis]